MVKHLDSEEVKVFEKDKGAGKEEVRRYGSGKDDEGGQAPVKDL